MPPEPLSARSIVGLLAEPDRLRVVAALVLGADGPATIGEQTQLGHDEVTVALTRLLRAGLVQTVDGTLRLRHEAFEAAVRAELRVVEPDDFGVEDPAVVKVLRSFLQDGRLITVPAPGRKRRVVLEYLVAAFEPGVRYDEEQVNAVLRAWHADYAALRRYLVEDSLLTREAGVYWRTGGWVDVL